MRDWRSNGVVPVVLAAAACAAPAPPHAPSPPMVEVGAPEPDIAPSSIDWSTKRTRIVDSNDFGGFLCRTFDDGRTLGCWLDDGRAWIVKPRHRVVSVAVGLNGPFSQTGAGAIVAHLIMDYMGQAKMAAAGSMSMVLAGHDGKMRHTFGDTIDVVEGMQSIEVVAGRTHVYAGITTEGRLLLYHLYADMEAEKSLMNGIPLSTKRVAELSLPGIAIDVDVHDNRGCAVVIAKNADSAKAGEVFCWEAEAGSLQRVDVPPARRVTVGVAHACSLTPSGDVWCWGDNSQGQMGQGHHRPVDGPVRHRFGKMTDLTAYGKNATCAVDAFDTICWGAVLHGLKTDTPVHFERPTMSLYDYKESLQGAQNEARCK